LFFGTISHLKGCDRLLRVLPELLQRHTDLRFVFIGRSRPDENGTLLSERIRDVLADFEDRVRVLPAQPHDALFRYVAHARFVALPSRADNLPNACLESLALGRLVVATRDASFEQLIDDGVNGLLVSQDDDSQLTAAMSKAWTMPAAQRAAFGEAARGSLARLHPETALQALIDMFRGVSEETTKARRKGG
jgi:glycosyltransferase involved in cell wall biosynthesis